MTLQTRLLMPYNALLSVEMMVVMMMMMLIVVRARARPAAVV
jgi:hypothetical protein